MLHFLVAIQICIIRFLRHQFGIGCTGSDWYAMKSTTYETVPYKKAAMIDKWKDDWACLFKALRTMSEKNSETRVHIRNRTNTNVEAINRPLFSYADRMGQIVYLNKMLKNDD